MRAFRSAETDAGIQDTGKGMELIAITGTMQTYKIQEMGGCRIRNTQLGQLSNKLAS